MTRADYRLLRRILWTTDLYPRLVGSIFCPPGTRMYVRVVQFAFIEGEGWQILSFEYLDIDSKRVTA